MTELATRAAELSPLMRFAQEASEVHGIAVALAKTSFVPKSMQGRPDEITGAILAGREMGLDPMTALASIDIIDGRPSVRANTQRGLAMAAGVVFEVLEASDTLVRMRAKAPGAKEWTSVRWPIERANQMGLTDKSNWKRMPQAMLIARATSELVRLVAANVLLGMPYSREEIEDGVVDDVTVAPLRAKAQRAQRQQVEMSTVEPGLEPGDGPVREIEAAPPPEPDAGLMPAPDVSDVDLPPEGAIGDTTRKAIMAGFSELGMQDRAGRLAAVSGIVGRDIASVNTLTEAEGRLVVRRIQLARANGDEVAS